MGLEVFFHVRSHGYEYPRDGFDNRGLKLRPKPASEATIRLKRVNIAERLYRATGQGIYRDSLLLGASVPLKNPVLNGQVMGQDTVIATPYRGKIYWFWGDTERVAYPLGNFAVSGATSELPGEGGLDPKVGVDLNYFVDAEGFSRRMCPDFGEGLHWIEGVMTVSDGDGGEKLVARVSSQKGLMPAYAWRLAVFNDSKGVFESKVRWDITEGHDSSHPFKALVGTNEYIYLYPNYRVPANIESLSDLANYESFTCITGDGRLRGADTDVDRDDRGHARYSWKPGADRLHAGRLRDLIKAGKLREGEAWWQLRDIETGREVRVGRGSVFWNEFRRRWVMVSSSERPGEIWWAESDTPTGPWGYGRRIVSHDDYNFYNPTQHPFFDQDGGRIIYFEGTYTASFSAAKEKTPRYDYNQIMYRLALDDPRLNLPMAVYRVRLDSGARTYLTREAIEERRLWDSIEDIAFFALPPERGIGGMMPIFAREEKGVVVLRDTPEGGSSRPAFFALPPKDSNSSEGNIAASDSREAAFMLPLYEYRKPTGNESYYSTELNPPGAEWQRSANAICRVWRNPVSVLPLDHAVVPIVGFGNRKGESSSPP
jgi:hypothetical protein